MKRRQFLGRSLAAGSLGCAFNADAAVLPGRVADQNQSAAKEGYARFEELNGALDRAAMQRGWLTHVDPGYQHAPQAALEDFKDRKFGIRIHWGLYCMIASDASWALAPARSASGRPCRAAARRARSPSRRGSGSSPGPRPARGRPRRPSR